MASVENLLTPPPPRAPADRRHGRLLLLRKPSAPRPTIASFVPRKISGEKNRPFRHARSIRRGTSLAGIGKATRLFPFFGTIGKTYEGVIRLGQATDTYDRTERPWARRPIPCPRRGGRPPGHGPPGRSHSVGSAVFGQEAGRQAPYVPAPAAAPRSSAARRPSASTGLSFGRTPRLTSISRFLLGRNLCPFSGPRPGRGPGLRRPSPPPVRTAMGNTGWMKPNPEEIEAARRRTL